MREEEKKAALAKAAEMLDANERVRVVEVSSTEYDGIGKHFRQGRERYLLIAVGQQLETEKMAVSILSSHLGQSR